MLKNTWHIFEHVHYSCPKTLQSILQKCKSFMANINLDVIRRGNFHYATVNCTSFCGVVAQQSVVVGVQCLFRNTIFLLYIIVDSSNK